MKKFSATRKLTVVTPFGTFSRNTKNDYHYVVLCSNDGEKWGAWGWSGSFDGAITQQEQARKVYARVHVVDARVGSVVR